MSRQLRALRRKELEFIESDSESEVSEVKKTANPFDEDGGEGDASQVSSASDSDEEEEDEPPIFLDLKRQASHEEAVHRESADRWELLPEKDVEEPQSEDGSENVEKIWSLTKSNFNPEVEMSRLSGSTRRSLKLSGTLVARRFGWLCPNNELLARLEDAQAGRRFVGFDPKSEIYLKMHQNSTDNSFYWVPTSRYLATYSTLEEIIGKGDVNMLHEFLALHRFHPAANLAMAESFVQRDQFESSHTFISRALGGFQNGMLFAFDPFCGDLSKCRLSKIDEREIADSLAILADDLVVDWSSAALEKTSSSKDDEEKNKTRKEQISQALRTPSLGNVLFIKCLQMYAWTLSQRGCKRTALEIFRLIHMITLENDCAHALLNIGELCAESRSPELLSIYDTSLYKKMADLKSARSTWRFRLKGISLMQAVDPENHPVASTLTFALPQFAFSMPLALLRSLPAKTEKEGRFLTDLEHITAEDFWSFNRASILNSFDQGEEDFLVGRDSIVKIHLLLLQALWLFPAFPALLLEVVETSAANKEAFRAELLASNFFTTGVNYLPYLDRVFPEDLSRVTKQAVGTTIRYSRMKLVEAYATQSKEIWSGLLFWLRAASAKMSRLAVMEQTCLTDLSLRDGKYVIPRSEIRAACMGSLLLSFPDWILGYGECRASEFDGRTPVLADTLLNSSPENVGGARAVQRRSLGGADVTPLHAWWKAFQDRTGNVNPNSDLVIVFLQSLLPWSRLDLTGTYTDTDQSQVAEDSSHSSVRR